MGCAYFTIMAGSKSEIGKDPVDSFRILSLVFYIKVFAFIVKL